MTKDVHGNLTLPKFTSALKAVGYANKNIKSLYAKLDKNSGKGFVSFEDYCDPADFARIQQFDIDLR